ncbi:MAG: ABC transporter permease [Gemmatimonadota bacterium]|jgi:predicted permease
MDGVGGGARDPGAGEEDRSAIEAELRFHIEGRAEELMASGLSPDEAWAAARAAFGDVERVRSELREIGRERARRQARREQVTGFIRDVRMGLRRLRRSPGYTVVAVMTLALGIGASVAMFTVLNAVLLRPLPYPSADRLVRLWPSENYNITLSREVGTSLRSVQSFTGLSNWGLVLAGAGEPEVLNTAVVDAGYFDTFGVRPELGRAFLADETDPSTSGVVILSHALWERRFGGDPSVIGRTIRLSGYDHETREVIGVMPASHQTPQREADAWIPLHVRAGHTVVSDSSWYVNVVVARLAPGATVAGANAELRALAVRLREESPGRLDEETVRTASVVTLRDSEVGDVRGLLWTLLAAVGLVLLIACANLANLVLARAAGHRRELAVRTALGAGRARLVRQQVAEGAILAAVGAGSGLLLARGLLALARVSEASGLPLAGRLPVDGRVVAFTVAASVGALILFGLFPALRATGSGLRSDVRNWTRGGSRDRQSHRLNRLLVTAEIALATMLATGAGLVLASFVTLRSVDPGIDPSDVLAVEVQPQADRYGDERAVQYYSELTARLAALPGVEAVGGVQLLPFTYDNWAFPYLAEGQTAQPDVPLPSANFRIVTGDYFGAVDQPLLEGRVFTAADRAGTEHVIAINRTLADELWPGASPIGKQLAVFGSMEMRVVGVVGDVRQHALDREPRPEMYVPFAQWGRNAQMVFMLEGNRLGGLGPEIRQVVRSIDPDVPITTLRPLSDVLGQSLDQRRFVMAVMATFGLLALLLGAVGVYGVMSNLVGARIPDFGVRLALGARPGSVLLSALSSGMLPAGAGMVLGIIGAITVSGVLRGLLFGIGPLDPRTYITVAVVLFTVATLASWIPARRAARSDPLSVLRTD